MNAVVIEHVLVSELPALWRAKLGEATFDCGSEVTVHLELRSAASQLPDAPMAATKNPLFGMWREREDLSDVAAYVQALRQPRWVAAGSPRNN